MIEENFFVEEKTEEELTKNIFRRIKMIEEKEKYLHIIVYVSVHFWGLMTDK